MLRANSHSTAKLCDVCSKLDIRRLTHPLLPCHQPLPCSTPPIKEFGTYLSLGSLQDIKSRRHVCDVCSLVASCLDKEPTYLDGECRIAESAQFCNFKLPSDVKALDPSITHFHLTQASVIFDTSMADKFQGPSLPWDLEARDKQSSHYILNLQTKAISCSEAGDHKVSPKTQQEYLDTIGGRYVGTQVNAQLIRAWLHRCESEHGKNCTPPLMLPPDLDKMPSFVIDVIESCVVDTPSQCRYVALSYVWGTAPVFKHLTENTRNLRKGGSLCSLPIPATIRDSMILVHAIGERYLWVDSICIIQDDLKMQQLEIKRMASIYSKALFSIIAATGDSADSGLAGVRPESREQTQKILKLADHELLTVIDVHNSPSGIDKTTWAQRAWTFQERILSNRVLVFSGTQVYWSCRAASYSEERALEQILDIDKLHLSFSQTPFTTSLSWEPMEPLEYSNDYDDLLYMYRQRRLTYQTDLLNAFDGVSQILAALQHDAFFWGLPESLFSYAMTWHFTGYSARNNVEVPIFQSNGSKQMVPFPSWSWAAWLGESPNNPLHLHGGDRSRVRPMTRFYIVDKELQLVEIKERTWEDEDQPRDSVRALWQKERPDLPPSLSRHSLPRIGQLYFWTSLASGVKVIRSWRVQGPGQLQYELFPPPDFQPDPHSNHYRSEIIAQDFIVVAACSPKTLVLLAVEWKDGVAYREGHTLVKEEDWVRVEKREWQLVTLG